MTLPTSRFKTFANGDVLTGSDANALQDGVVALGLEQFKAIIAPADFTYEDVDTDVDIDIKRNCIEWKDGAGSPGIVFASIPVRVGNVIVAAVAYVLADAGNDTVTLRIQRTPRATGVAATVGTGNRSTPGEISVAAINHVVLEDSAYTVELEAEADGGGSDNIQVTYVELTIQRVATP